MARLISRTEFARIANVTQAAITKACNGRLSAACHGVRIDVAHAAAQAYLAHRLGADAARGQPGQPKTPVNGAAAPPAPTGPGRNGSAAPPAVGPATGGKEPVRLVSREVTNINDVADMTIRQVVSKFGTVTAFKDWLGALRTIEEVREKNLRNAETDGNLISIRLVQTHVMGALESGYRRLLTDSPKTIARQVYAAAKADVPIEDAENLVRESISSQLKPMKDAAAKSLRGHSSTDSP